MPPKQRRSTRASTAPAAAAAAEPTGPISAIEKVDDITTRFRISNDDGTYPIAFVNAMRRILLADIPMWAIDRNHILFLKHNCFLNESILSDRLTFAYLKQLPEIQYDTLELYLNITNDTDDIRYVYLEDFQVRGPGAADIFVFPKCIFAALRPDQELEITARFIRGTKHHLGAPHQAAISSYKFVRDEALVKQKADAIESDYDRQSYLVCDADRDYRRREGSDQPTDYAFEIETTGGYTPAQLFHLGLQIMKQKISNFMEALSHQDISKIQLEEKTAPFPHWIITVYQESHTLGSLLQTMSLIYMQEKISFCGYHVPHPLDGNIVIKFALVDTNEFSEIVNIFAFICGKINDSIDRMMRYSID